MEVEAVDNATTATPHDEGHQLHDSAASSTEIRLRTPERTIAQRRATDAAHNEGHQLHDAAASSTDIRLRTPERAPAQRRGAEEFQVYTPEGEVRPDKPRRIDADIMDATTNEDAIDVDFLDLLPVKAEYVDCWTPMNS